MAQNHSLQSQKEELEKAKLKAEAEPELSKLLASHDFASCLPTELKELPSKITGLSEEIKGLKQHIKDIEIDLPRDLIEIPTKLKSFTSTISSLSSQVAKLKNIQWKPPAEFLNLPSQVSSVQEKLKTLDSLPSLLHKITHILNSFSTMADNASGAPSMNVPSADVATQYYTKKILFDKYCDKMLKKKKNPKITKYEVRTKKIPITLKIYWEDGSDEVISNLKFSDLHSAEWRKVLQACPDKSKKGWKTISDLVKTIVDQLTQTEQELNIDLNQPFKEQDPLNELIDLASVAEVPSASALQVLRILESIFTSVYAAVQKLKDSWLEIQISLVDNIKLNVVYLPNRS
nr:putative reverse transcriptase domain-containing protein [Tanacetum cinerariifolium]